MEQKEEISIQPEQDEETRIQKNEKRLRNLQDTFKHFNIWIIGVPEGEEEEQEIENLFELPQSGKENRLPGSPGSSESPKEVGTKEAHTKTHHNYITQGYKDKERILKAARKKETVTYKGVPITLSADFSKETLRARRGWKEIFEVTKSKEHPRLLYPAKLSFRMEGQIKCFPDKVKLKEFIITKPLLYEMLKGLI